MNNRNLKILLVDRQEIFRIGLKMVLSKATGITVVEDVSTENSILPKIELTKPDIILIDDLETSLRLIKRKIPSRILLLTNIISEDELATIVKAGILGFLEKTASPEELVESIRKLNCGLLTTNPTIATQALRLLITSHDLTAEKTSQLTSREIEILQLVATGRDNKTISNELNISCATVSTHLNNIFCKLGLANRVQATLYALRNGLSSL
ncbi:LuxR C-terminal-related transcriptional regulator [Halodesulfovibrio spirochaetisodalis]|uniref:LuxR family transcriptional regulator n=1 Tax=Halodesulfovibrio spirochaetisodalis TaxID=1560234 RepID=A0A1B7X9H7_9BACT|nr:response regulator transcription factor [Halodesulfovibrio spirochaetisodalis]OBQ46006.1 hypothetical protein SP90_15040 [Halodesulfovibrio spirochaetisodalis]